MLITEGTLCVYPLNESEVNCLLQRRSKDSVLHTDSKQTYQNNQAGYSLQLSKSTLAQVCLKKILAPNISIMRNGSMFRSKHEQQP